MDIVRTDSEQRALKAAEDSGKARPRPAEGANDTDKDKEWAAYKVKLADTQSYKDVMKQYGVGSSFQQAAQAATAAIQALAGGDIKQAIAGGAAPYLAQLVKEATLPAKGEPTPEQKAANLMGHAVVGAVVAQLSGKDAGAGALGAASGAQAGRNAVENNALSLRSGLMNYGQTVASWNQYALDHNLTPEQTQEGLNRIAIGEGPSWGAEYKVKP